MLKVGEINKLTVLRGTSVGYFLGDEEENDVLLPHKYIPDNTQPGDVLDVFIYRDSEDRLIATNLTPLIKLNEFACLRVVAETSFGAFLDWGLEKDLLVPFREQNQKLKEGDWVFAYLYLDTESDRLVASCRINRHFEQENVELEQGQEVNIKIFEETDLGFNAIINNKYRGLVYHNEIFSPINWGDELTAYVKNIREDNRIDLSLRKDAYQHISADADKIHALLEQNNGRLELSDKSSPEEIKLETEMSKKAFKRAVGSLYKAKNIIIGDGFIELTNAVKSKDLEEITPKPITKDSEPEPKEINAKEIKAKEVEAKEEIVKEVEPKIEEPKVIEPEVNELPKPKEKRGFSGGFG